MNSILITGAGSGLGKELALLFSQNNYHLLLVGRSKEKLEKVKAEIEQQGGSADVISTDIRSFDELVMKFKRLTEHYSIEGVVNNAGVGHFGPLLKMDEREIVDMIETNLLGTIFVTKAILPILVEQSSGFVMNIISTAGLRGKVNEAAYVASKFGVRGFTQSLQKEYDDSNIRFMAVYMGGMDTPFWENSDHIKDSSRLRSAREVAEIIMEQFGQPEIVIEGR
ncbi:SDR family NAD(P)-dependent oxidoreductase [Pseudoneobacillus sp. C159]